MPAIQTPPNIVWNVVDEEALLLDIETGNYFSLNAVATEIWNKLNEGKSQEEVAQELSAKYEVSAGDIQNDISDLLTELNNAGILK